MTKKCSKCKKEKELFNFYNRSIDPSGKNPYCIECLYTPVIKKTKTLEHENNKKKVLKHIDLFYSNEVCIIELSQLVKLAYSTTLIIVGEILNDNKKDSLFVKSENNEISVKIKDIDKTTIEQFKQMERNNHYINHDPTVGDWNNMTDQEKQKYK